MAGPDPIPSEPEPDDAHSLSGMEVWGGSEAADTTVSVPGVEVRVHCRPYRGEHEGGDIHYVSTCSSGVFSRFVLADVAGHGASAGALAETLRRLMRKHINTPDQTRFARALNEEFGRLADAGRFATALAATYFAPTDHLIVCNAGHPRPLWYHAAEGRWSLMDRESPEASAPLDRGPESLANLPLGVIDPTSYHQFAVWLAPGDVVVAYTDALIEGAGEGRGPGEEGLLDAVRSMTPGDPAGLGPALLAMLDGSRAGRPVDDDLTLMVLCHTASNPPELTIAERIRALGRLLGLIR